MPFVSCLHLLIAWLLTCAGTVNDECFLGSEGRDWYAYWRLLFSQVDENDILNFESKYKGTFVI